MKSRKIFKNTIFGSLYKFIDIILKFILRSYLIKGLGGELVGLNTILNDWMSMLNLASLGIEIAIQFRLYQPIAEKDDIKISQIVRSAQIIYRKIGFIILGMGLIIMPLMPFMIKDSNYSIAYVCGAYLIYLSGVFLSYFWCFKRIVIQAYEDIYILNILDIINEVVFISLEILVVLKTRSLYLFVILCAGKIVCEHFFAGIICDKKFKIRKIQARNREEEKRITSDLSDVAPLKVANYIFGYADNVVISKFIGLVAVTIYSNYMIIANTIFGISTMIVNATKASFGIQLELEKEHDVTKQKLDLYIFLQFVLSMLGALSFLVVMDAFISLWVGKDFVIGQAILTVMSIEIFLRMIYQPLQMIFEATGQFKRDKWITGGSVIINILISIILVRYLGLIGPIIGTLITDCIMWFFRFKSVELEYFGQKLSVCLKKWIMFLFSFLLGVIFAYIWKQYLESVMSGILYLIVGEIGILGIGIVLILVFFGKSQEYKEMKKGLNKLLKR